MIPRQTAPLIHRADRLVSHSASSLPDSRLSLCHSVSHQTCRATFHLPPWLAHGAGPETGGTLLIYRGGWEAELRLTVNFTLKELDSISLVCMFLITTKCISTTWSQAINRWFLFFYQKIGVLLCSGGKKLNIRRFLYFTLVFPFYATLYC